MVKFDCKKKKQKNKTKQNKTNNPHSITLGKLKARKNEYSTIDALFLKRKPTKQGQMLYFREKSDASEVPLTDVLYKLPKPSSGGTKRTGDIFTFKTCVIEDGEYNVL